MAQLAAEYTKSLFSATESFLYKLKEAYGAVRDVLKFGFHQETVARDDCVNEDKSQSQIDGSHQESKSSKFAFLSQFNTVFKACYFPFTAIFSLKCCARSHDTGHCCLCAKSLIDSGLNCCICAKSYGLLHTFVAAMPFLIVFYLVWIYYDDNISKFLTLFEQMDPEVAVALFMIFFIVASLPLVWGYVILNLAAGYRFGVIYGVFVVLISVSLGLSLTHKISKKLCAGCITRSLKCYDNTNRIEAILKVLDGPNGLKVVALTRLTPIPFGLQNGIFAMSNIQTRYYVAASNIGLLPTQVLNCYIGSTFRSAEDIVANGGSAHGYIIFFFQLTIGLLLMTYVLRHAGKELTNVLNSSNSAEAKSGDNASQEQSLTEVRVTQPTSGVPV